MDFFRLLEMERRKRLIERRIVNLGPDTSVKDRYQSVCCGLGDAPTRPCDGDGDRCSDYGEAHGQDEHGVTELHWRIPSCWVRGR